MLILALLLIFITVYATIYYISFCDNGSLFNQVNDWAREAFFTFGGNPKYNFDLKPTTLGPNFSMSPDMSINQGMSMCFRFDYTLNERFLIMIVLCVVTCFQSI